MVSEAELIDRIVALQGALSEGAIGFEDFEEQQARLREQLAQLQD